MELNPEKRFGAKEAIKHPWMMDYDKKFILQQKEVTKKNTDGKTSRQAGIQSRVRECDGAHASAFEISPSRDTQELSKKSYSRENI